jgi:hypothetical protein
MRGWRRVVRSRTSGPGATRSSAIRSRCSRASTNALSLQFDVTEGQWSRLGYWNTTTGQWEADRGVGFAFAFGKRLTVDRTTADVWELAPDVYYDGGTQPRRWLRQSPYLADEGQWLFHDRLDLLAEMGVGASTVELRYSDDGAKTYSNARTATFGATGQYANRAFWGRLGGVTGAGL